MSAILIQPHDDDAVLFACWTLLRLKPLVVTVFDSYVQPARGIPGTSAQERAVETDAACEILGVGNTRLHFRDDDESVTAEQIQLKTASFLMERGDIDMVIAPAFEDNGHHQHNLVARAFTNIACQQYLTYTRKPDGKSTSVNEVPFKPEWVSLKLRALAEFKSQFQPAAGCVEHFIGRSLREYTL